MGTLQTELMKLTTLDNLTFDDDPTPPPTQEITMATATTNKSLRQQYWEWLRDNPSSTAREMADAFGLEQTAVANILLKFLARGLVVRTKHGESSYYCYTTAVDEYPVMPPEEKVRRMNEANKKKPPRRYKVNRAKAHTSEPAAPVTAPLPPNMRFTASVPELLNTLSIMQARSLYDELKKVFGG